MDRRTEKNIVVAVFKVESEGFQAFTELKHSAAAPSYFVTAGALVKKENGVCTALDIFDTGAETDKDVAMGGLIGLLVGVLGGPIGMLLGVSVGSYFGMANDTATKLYGASMIEQIAYKLDDGMTAIIAFADEDTPDELDKRFSAYDTVIARFDASAVAGEVNEAIDMQEEMARQARENLRREKKEEGKAKLEENKEIFRHGFSK